MRPRRPISILFRKPVFWPWVVAVTVAVLVADGLLKRYT
jgi:hypothetical protein